jgi:hypothetical protein
LIVGSPSLPEEAESSSLRVESPGVLPVESPSLPAEGSPISQESSGYSSLPRSTQLLLAQPPAAEAEDLSFCLPEPLNLDDLLHDDSPGVEDEDVPLLEVRRSSQPTTDDEPQFRQSDLVLNPKSDLALNQLESRELRQLGLEQQARLLEKDRELARAGQQVRESQQEVEQLRAELANSAESNRAMMGIVEEFEKTISQLISEKERESVCNVITRERSAEQIMQVFNTIPLSQAAD